MARAAFSAPAATTAVWLEPPRDLPLVPGEMHVWRVPLTAQPAEIARFTMTLDAGERARALRFRMRRDRDRFVVSHAALRAIVGDYLGCDPADVRFEVGPSGKPVLADPGTDLRFNLSHSDTLALVAVARGREVGVDVERVRDDLAESRIAEMFFAPSDVAALDALPAVERTAAFFHLWSSTEAFVKARGSGLAGAASGSDATPLVTVTPDGTAGPAWTIVTLTPGAGHSAAVAAEGTGWTLACWQYAPRIEREASRRIEQRRRLIASPARDTGAAIVRPPELPAAA